MSKPESDFEKELTEIKTIVQKLSDPEITLSQSVKLYKEGQEKLKNASKTLEDAKLQIEEYDAKSNA